jgi:hypothetical protein
MYSFTCLVCFVPHTVADIFMYIKIYRGVLTLVQIYMLGIHWFVNSLQSWYNRDTRLRLWIGICFLMEECVVGESYVIEALLAGTLSCDGIVFCGTVLETKPTTLCVLRCLTAVNDLCLYSSWPTVPHLLSSCCNISKRNDLRCPLLLIMLPSAGGL